jgi:hypothetical protein
MALVLKTSERDKRSVGSNPTLSSTFYLTNRLQYGTIRYRPQHRNDYERPN